MTKDERDLLIKDIFARLPYGVKGITEYGSVSTLKDWKTEQSIFDGIKYCVTKHGWRPYLFPISSLSEELREEYKDLWDNDGYRLDANDNVFTLQDFYCKYHIDYRGLIPMGLANDATGKNIY